MWWCLLKDGHFLISQTQNGRNDCCTNLLILWMTSWNRSGSGLSTNVGNMEHLSELKFFHPQGFARWPCAVTTNRRLLCRRREKEPWHHASHCHQEWEVPCWLKTVSLLVLSLVTATLSTPTLLMPCLSSLTHTPPYCLLLLCLISTFHLAPPWHSKLHCSPPVHLPSCKNLQHNK